jgi:hypothetical protein
MIARPISKGLSGSLMRRQIKPESYVDEIYREGRQSHTQKKFVPKAMKASLAVTSRRKAPLRHSPYESTVRTLQRSPSTLRLNRSSVKHKSAGRGHGHL